MRVAAIDCGTNSIRLLIADIDGSNFREITRQMEVVRLGQGVDKTGAFHPDAITRTLAAVDLYAAEIAKRGVEKIRFCATSATRDATNRALFIDGVKERLGIEPEVAKEVLQPVTQAKGVPKPAQVNWSLAAESEGITEWIARMDFERERDDEESAAMLLL